MSKISFRNPATVAATSTANFALNDKGHKLARSIGHDKKALVGIWRGSDKDANGKPVPTALMKKVNLEEGSVLQKVTGFVRKPSAESPVPVVEGHVVVLVAISMVKKFSTGREVGVQKDNGFSQTIWQFAQIPGATAADAMANGIDITTPGTKVEMWGVVDTIPGVMGFSSDPVLVAEKKVAVWFTAAKSDESEVAEPAKGDKSI